MKHILLISTLFLLSFAGLAQNTTISGKVTDTFKEGISDVSIIVKGTTKGTATDENGNYSLNVKQGEHTLVFSAIGLKTIRKKVNANKSTIRLNLVLEDDVVMLDEATIKMERKLKVNKLNIRNLDAPMTTNTVSYKLIEQANATNIEEAAKNITGLQSVNRYGGFHFFNIRGFENFVLLYDGVRDERHNIARSATYSNLANVERIEVLKGPSGDMFGHSALGGIMNVIRKKPSYSFEGNFKATIGSYNTANVTLGVGGPINDKLRYRVDAGRNSSRGFKNISSLTNNVSFVLDYSLTDSDKFELFLQYSNDDYGVDVGIPGTDDGKAIGIFNPKINYADPTDYLTDVKKEGQLTYTHKFNSNTFLTNKFFITDGLINYLGDEVLFIDAGGKTFSRRNYGGYHFDRIAKTLGNQFDLSFKFNTGGIKHKSIVGTSFNYLKRVRYWDAITATVPISEGISITNPINPPSQKKTLSRNNVITQKDYVTAIYLQDWITFTNKFKILLGARYDFFDGSLDSKRKVTDQPNIVKGSQGNFTYRGALSYQAVEDLLTLYGSASSFFKPVRDHGHRNEKLFKPETGVQFEGGLKMEVKDKLNLTLAGFYIKKNDFIVGHGKQNQVKQATSRGLELDADAEPFKGFYVRFGYAYTDAYFSKGSVTQKGKDYSYNKTPWTPEHQANLWLNYEISDNVLDGLGFGFGANYVGKTFQNPANTQSLPEYTVLNGTIYYQTKNNIRVGLNIENLANTLYYSSALSSDDLWYYDENTATQQAQHQIYPGRDRNFKLSISYNF